MQLFSKTSDNIQKLFDLSTRIDERVRIIQTNQVAMEGNIAELVEQYHDVMSRVVVIQSERTQPGSIPERVADIEKQLTDLDKRLAVIEMASKGMESKWNRIASFAIQLVWVVLAAWVLLQLKLQAPAVP